LVSLSAERIRVAWETTSGRCHSLSRRECERRYTSAFAIVAAEHEPGTIERGDEFGVARRS
jgi:hypothetical protein